MKRLAHSFRDPVFCTIFVISISLIILDIVRIFNVALTFDEAGTYTDHTTYTTFMWSCISSNNHILNSLLRKFFIDTFSNNFFFIRLGSLLAFLVYLISAYKLCRLLFQKPLWAICGFLLLNMYPLVFEFWGLGRGYSLAVAFMLASIYQILIYYSNNKNISLHLSFIYAILAVYSNFSLLDYYFGFAGFILLRPLFFKKDQRSLVWECAALLLYTCILYLLIAGPIKKLIAAGEFYYGGATGIVHDTIYSLIGYNLYIQASDPHHHTIVHTITSFIVIFSVVPGIYWVVKYAIPASRKKTFTGCLLWVLFAAPVVATMLMHTFLQTKYLIDRTALFLIALFALQLCYWLYIITQQYPLTGNSVITILTILISYNFLTNINISATRQWWTDEFNVIVLKKIVRESQNKKDKNKLAVFWIFEPSLRYYTDGQYSKYFYSITGTRNEASDDTTFDYYYMPRDMADHISKRYAPDTSFHEGAFVLFKKQ